MYIERVKPFENIYQVPEFEDELNGLIDEGRKDGYLRYLANQLRKLEALGMRALSQDRIEPLVSTENPKLYKIKHLSDINERHIFVFFEGEQVLLLCAFKEKSKSDYRKSIALAQSRYKKAKREGDIK